MKTDVHNFDGSMAGAFTEVVFGHFKAKLKLKASKFVASQLKAQGAEYAEAPLPDVILEKTAFTMMSADADSIAGMLFEQYKSGADQALKFKTKNKVVPA